MQFTHPTTPIRGWEILNAYEEVLATNEDDGTLGRETQDEVALRPRLQGKLEKFNPDVPGEQIEKGISDLIDKVQPEKLVMDWTKQQQRIADVKITIVKELG